MVSPKSWNIQRCRAYRLPTLGQGSADTKQHGAGKCGPVKNMAVKSGLAGFMAVNSFTLKKGNLPQRKARAISYNRKMEMRSQSLHINKFSHLLTGVGDPNQLYIGENLDPRKCQAAA